MTIGKCTCIRCRAEKYVRKVFPKISDRAALAAAQDIVKVIQAIPKKDRGSLKAAERTQGDK